jgi:hypothetical protein
MTVITTTPTSIESPVRPAGRAGRWATAAVLVAGATLQLVEELIEPPFAVEADRFRWMATDTTLHSIDVIIGLWAIPFMIAGTLLLARRARRMPRLAWTGAALGLIGFSALAAVHGFEAAEVALFDAGVSPATMSAATDHLQPALGIPLLAMFLGTLSIGLPMLMVALWRSRAVPRGAIVVIFAFMALDFFGPEMPFPSHGLSFIAFTWMAVAIALGRTGGARPADSTVPTVGSAQVVTGLEA